MLRLNMIVNIDVLADDQWGSSRAWVENEVMRKIENSMIDLFECPLSVTAELEYLNIEETEEKDE